MYWKKWRIFSPNFALQYFLAYKIVQEKDVVDSSGIQGSWCSNFVENIAIYSYFIPVVQSFPEFT